MSGKCVGMLAFAFLFASQATTFGGWCGTPRYCHTSHHHCCYTPHHCCYTPHHCHIHHCCRPCPPCPPVYRACDCIYNATNKVLSVSVTHGGGTESRACLKPGYWFKFSFDPSKYNTAVVVAYESGTNNLIINEEFGLVPNAQAPYGCMHIFGNYAAGAPASGGATLQRGSGAAQPIP